MMARGTLTLAITLFSFMVLSVMGLSITHEADRPKGYGLTAEISRKQDAKFDQGRADQACQWISDVLRYGGDDELAQTVSCSGMSEIHETFKNGILLDHFINVIKPGSVKKINQSKMAFKMMENIGSFLTACQAIGVLKQDLFQTVDLYESQNIPQVINGIFSVGRRANKIIVYNGPVLGPKEAPEKVREFSEDQLRAGRSIIGLQAGSNRGASQAGLHFSKTRTH